MAKKIKKVKDQSTIEYYKKIDIFENIVKEKSENMKDDAVQLQIKAAKACFNDIQNWVIDDNSDRETVESTVNEYVKDHMLADLKLYKFFYYKIAMEYFINNKDEIKNILLKTIGEGRNIFSNDFMKDFNEDLENNLECTIFNIWLHLKKKAIFAKNEEYKEIINIMDEGKIDSNNIDKVCKIIYMQIDELYYAKFNEVSDKIASKPEYYVDFFKNNPEYFIKNPKEDLKKQIGQINSNEDKSNNLFAGKKDKNSNISISSVAFDNAKTRIKDVMYLAEFTEMPFFRGISSNKENKKSMVKDREKDLHNLALLFHNVVSTALNESEIADILYIIKVLLNPKLELKENFDAKKSIYSFVQSLGKDFKYMNNNQAISKRLVSLLELLREIGLIEQVNEYENKKNKIVGLECLNLDYKELSEILNKLPNNDFISEEGKLAMLAFYSNRTVKKLETISRLGYIYEKLGVYDDIEKGKLQSIDKYDFSEKNIKDLMLKFDSIKEIVEDDFYKKYSYKEKYNNRKEVLTPEIKEEYINKMLEYKEAYSLHFGGRLLEDDLSKIISHLEAHDHCYRFKTNMLSELIYTAQNKNEKSGILNWGYVIGDRNLDPNVILLGFDIKYMNMPLILHVKKIELINILKLISGKMEIPIYEGSFNISNFSKKGLSEVYTSVLYPLNSNQRKQLKKIDTKSVYVKHIKSINNLEKINKEYEDKYYDVECGQICSKIKAETVDEVSGQQNNKKSDNDFDER